MTGEQRTYRVTYWICCLMLAATFLSGYHKLIYPESFALAVYRFHLLPDAWVNIGSLYFQWLEVVCALCLLFVPKLRWAALWVTLILLILFTGAIGINLIRGTAFSCGCFSNAPDAQPMSWMSIVRNVMLIGLAVLAFVAQKRSRREAGPSNG